MVVSSDRWVVGTLLLAAIGIAALNMWGFAARPGPWWLWAIDACPARNVSCGMIALGPMLITGGVSIAAIGAIHYGAKEASA